MYIVRMDRNQFLRIELESCESETCNSIVDNTKYHSNIYFNAQQKGLKHLQYVVECWVLKLLQQVQFCCSVP